MDAVELSRLVEEARRAPIILFREAEDALERGDKVRLREVLHRLKELGVTVRYHPGFARRNLVSVRKTRRSGPKTTRAARSR